MNKVFSLIVMSSAFLFPLTSHADEFDITMDVVGANESFDEVIVNRIALPFAARSDRQALERVADDAGLAGEVIDGMVDVVDEPVDSSGFNSGGFDAGSILSDRDLPNPADLGY